MEAGQGPAATTCNIQHAAPPVLLPASWARRVQGRNGYKLSNSRGMPPQLPCTPLPPVPRLLAAPRPRACIIRTEYAAVRALCCFKHTQFSGDQQHEVIYEAASWLGTN